jgi:uncharacterized protein YjbI with pentapeptide repeats
MANEEHLKILKQGVEVWNKWRKDNPQIKPDLGNADLGRVNLSNADHSYANLVIANFKKAELSGSHLSEAKTLK